MLAQSTVDYSQSTLDVLIPFWNSPSADFSFTDGPRVKFRVDTQIYQPVIDTGSCGLIVSAAEFPNWTPELAGKYPVGVEYLSSSKKLYVGNWIDSDIVFLQADVAASFPILVVSTRYICPGYDFASDGPNCTSPTETIDMPANISLLGVGFGRQFDGQPQGNPDKNPFLNIVSIDGTPINAASNFRTGYKISKEGVTLGLTANNTAGFNFVGLDKGVTDDLRDWAPVPAGIRVGTAPFVSDDTTALLDTGIDQMYLTVPYSMPVETHIGTSLSSGANVSVLDDGQVVEVQYGRPSANAASYSFKVGDVDSVETGVAPPQVIVRRSSTKKPFVNTGRHIYRGFEIVFDAAGGRYGFKATS
ncbi:hypothetical protein LAWI1_G001567 [Lachnellula willkommii]|uniref:Peptidase A1 domain-containing protein n=1 Tax=Lachnellula willkommii TaxID=215461 RepID=A0A559MID4_9HELO|nr:hypothetical protein LAWI1_G001567 [Lachnellula willkommii]